MATPTTAPTKKVVAATGGAAVGPALALLICWAANRFLPTADAIPQDVQDALAIVASVLVSFIAGYYTSPDANETVASVSGKMVSAHAAVPAAAAGGQVFN
ncbi:MAG: hypothetical protein ACYDD1_15120 [Caulobacteraceae bacterium]